MNKTARNFSKMEDFKGFLANTVQRGHKRNLAKKGQRKKL
jgi:hypothetical protein